MNCEELCVDQQGRSSGKDLEEKNKEQSPLQGTQWPCEALDEVALLDSRGSGWSQFGTEMGAVSR